MIYQAELLKNCTAADVKKSWCHRVGEKGFHIFYTLLAVNREKK